MKALTVHRPWDYALLNGKAVENRPWKPPAALVGERFALHAGHHYDYDGAKIIKDRLGLVGPIPLTHPGMVFATVKLVGWVELDTAGARKAGLGTLASHAEAAVGIGSPWLTGPVGWVLAELRALERPIPCRGFQRLWALPAAVEARVFEQLEAA